MRYLVLGAGAMGGFFGARLLKGGADVSFLVRPRRAAQLTENGLVVKAQDGDIRAPVKVVQAGEIDGTFDVVLLCCKAYDLDGAIEAIAPAMGPDSAVLPILNGLRHIDTLSARFGAERVLGGMTAVNTVLEPSGEIWQSPLKLEMNVLGELSGDISARCKAIQAAFAAGGTSFTVSDDIAASMWAKFFGFVAIATTSSLTRARAGRIATSAAGADFVGAVIEECNAVATAAGYPQTDLRDTVRGIYSQPESTYGPSMLVDMEEGRQTEAEHTIGDMVRRGRALGVPVPLLTAALCNLQCHELGLASV